MGMESEGGELQRLYSVLVRKIKDKKTKEKKKWQDSFSEFSFIFNPELIYSFSSRKKR